MILFRERELLSPKGLLLAKFILFRVVVIDKRYNLSPVAHQ